MTFLNIEIETEDYITYIAFADVPSTMGANMGHGSDQDKNNGNVLLPPLISNNNLLPANEEDKLAQDSPDINKA